MTGEQVVGLDGCTLVEIDAAREGDTRSRILSATSAQELAHVFDLLSDPNRIRIVFTLLEAGELCVHSQVPSA